MSLTFHLLNSSVCITEHLLKSIVGFETFELDNLFDCASSNKLSYRQQLRVSFDKEFGQLLPYLILSSSGQLHGPGMVAFLPGCLSYLWLKSV